MRKKKIMLDHIKGKRNQRVYADQVIKKLTEKLMAGWNPWIEELQPLEYTKWDDVLDRYKSYLAKMCNEGSMREETYVDYSSRLRILEKWKQEKRITLNYSYQWDKSNVSKFLDYIFIDRNNTVLTRNNYLAWTKSFSAYLLARGIYLRPYRRPGTYQEQAEEKQRCHTGLYHAAHQRLPTGAQQALSAGL